MAAFSSSHSVASLMASRSCEMLVFGFGAIGSGKGNHRVLTVSLSSSSILPPRPSSSLTWFLREKA